MKFMLLITMCVAMADGVNADSCETSSSDTCTLFPFGSDLVSAQDLLEQGLTSGGWFELYSYELNSPHRYGKCRHRWLPGYPSNVIRRQTTCYNIDLQRCQAPEWSITMNNDTCGRAVEDYGENSSTSRIFYSQDSENYLWFRACHAYTESGDCSHGYIVLIVKDTLILQNDELNLTGLPWPSISADLKNNFDFDFTNPELRFVWNGPECGYDGNIVYKLNGAFRAEINFIILMCALVVTHTFSF